MNTETINWE